MSNDVWQRIEEARDRWNVLEHPFYQRWSAGELSREELAELLRPVPPRDRGDRPAQRRRRRVRPRGRARRAAPPRRGGGGPHRPLGRLRRGGRRRGRRCAHGGDAGVRRRLDRGRRPPLPAGPPLRDRERPAGDLADQARGPRRPLRDRRRAGQRVLPGPRARRRRARGRGPLADRGPPRRRRPRRAGRGGRVGLQGELAPARRGHADRRPRHAVRSSTTASMTSTARRLPRARIEVLVAGAPAARAGRSRCCSAAIPALRPAIAPAPERIAPAIAVPADLRRSLESRRAAPPAGRLRPHPGGLLLAFGIAGRASSRLARGPNARPANRRRRTPRLEQGD